jgi:inorganic pyrophosphatase
MRNWASSGPGDYGFIPGTLSDDGDPLDVLALVEEPSFSGLPEVRADQKILAVPNRKELEGRATATLGWGACGIPAK